MHDLLCVRPGLAATGRRLDGTVAPVTDLHSNHAGGVDQCGIQARRIAGFL